MIQPETSAYLSLLRNKIDIKHVPFSDRGSRLLVLLDKENPSFSVKLAERLTMIQPDIEAYLHRPPFIKDFYLLDEDGQVLDFKVTTYPHIVYLETQRGEFAMVFQDAKTISLGLPPRSRAGIRFHVQPQFWETTDGGGVFMGVRNLVYMSNCETVHNEITPDQGGYVVEYIVQAGDDSAITISIQSAENVPPLAQSFSRSSANAEARWRDWFSRVPPVKDKFKPAYAYAWWIMANNLIGPQGQVAYEAMMPSKLSYVGLWLWDSAMHALAYRYVDPELARNQIRAMLAYQLADGMLPDAVYDEGVIATIDHPISAEVTKPPY